MASEKSPERAAFVDASTECAICLEPFEEDIEKAQGETQQQGCRRILTLNCGHKWHLSCLSDQIQTAQPVPGQRILFNGCQCAKCGMICDHPDLEHLTRTTDVLRDQVNALIEEQLALELPDVWKNAQQEQPSESHRSAHTSLVHLLHDARRRYAFYLCSHCKQPYFGGTIECADALEPPTMSSSAPTEQRLCVACTPHSQILCQNPLAHARYIIWKCRFCCQPATHVCYGNTHFCNDCHDRNVERYKVHPPSSRPHHIAPIPCPGPATCPYPLPPSSNSASTEVLQYHHNGPTVSSEQVYGCAWCQSNTTQRLVQHRRQAGSHNLLQNPSGASHLAGWTQRGRQMSWQVEPLEVPFEDSTAANTAETTTTTNFVSSFLPCIMQQTIDLHRIIYNNNNDSQPPRQSNSPSLLRFEVSARYMGRSDCPSIFQLQALILEDRSPTILAQASSPVLETPPDYWEMVELELPAVPSNRARHVVVVVSGRDKKYWRGNYGSKVCDIQLRLLGTEEELQNWLISPERPTEANLQDLPVEPVEQQQQGEGKDTSSPNRNVD